MDKRGWRSRGNAGLRKLCHRYYLGWRVREGLPARPRSGVGEVVPQAGDEIAGAGCNRRRRALEDGGAEPLSKHLSRHPLTGSLRFAFEFAMPELPTWPLRFFPYLIFYVADEDHVDIWRILHAHRNIPASLAADSQLDE